MDTDNANGSAESKPKTRKVKKQVRKGDLPISAGTASLDQALKDAMAEKENMMIMEDKLVADTEDKKNELESFIYELKGKIDDVYSEFASEDEKAKLREKLDQSEDWLYDEGEDVTKAVYVAKIEEIRAVAGPIVQRYLDKAEEERQAAMKLQEEAAAKKAAEEEEKRKAEEGKAEDAVMKDAPPPQAGEEGVGEERVE
ncbi:Heat shock protein hsp88 [Elasticomyces elasticus]|nr:Heat shock protein hsp88 [Elasticomyces elasticus]